MDETLKFIKQKAIFMIFVMICAIFTIQLIQPVKAESKVCCEKTAAGSIYGEESCIFTEPTNCNPSYRSSGVACEQTDYCGSGCCIVDGECNKNTPRSTCLNAEGAWYPGIDCSIPKCQKGCCSLPAECSLVPEAKCAEEIEIYETLKLSEVFDPSITSELACQQQCLAIEEGCCDSVDTCKFTSRKDCNENFPDSQFFKNTVCSALPSCRVTEKHHTGCLPDKDEVYWFDSAGNRENIYGTPYDPDGLVSPKEESCDPNEDNVKDSTCGNCDYSKGSICAEADEDFLAGVPSEYKGQVSNMCISLDCDTTTDKSNVNPWMTGQERKNQESWCEYEGTVGGGKDLVGSRQYRYLCVNGREIIEPCSEKREEICVQQEIPDDLVERGLSAAICRPNLHVACAVCNDEDSEEFNKYALDEDEKNKVDCGGECDVYLDKRDNIRKDEEGNSLESELKECCKKQVLRKKCCEDNFLKDCYWNDAVKMCAPAVPPGNSDNCFGEVTCTEFWERPGLLRAWDCVENCDEDKAQVGKCYSEEYTTAINRFCRSWGDCGAHYNIEGKFTRTGFSSSGPSPVTELKGPLGGVQVKLKNPEDPKQDPWNQFNKQNKPIEGNLYLAYYIANLIYSIEMPEDSQDFAATLGDWLWTTIPISAVFATALVVSLVLELPLFAVLGEFATFTAAGIEATTTLAPAWGLMTPLLWAAVIIFVLFFLFELFKDNKVITYTYTCGPWQPPSGGEDCEKCMEYSKCDEYKCESLGRLCEFINQGGEGICVISEDRNDATPPIIEPLPIPPRTMNDFIQTPSVTGRMGGYEFKDIIKVYTPLEIGIKTLDVDGSEEYAQCKISRFHKDYEEMTNWFGDNYYSYEHKMEIPVAYEAIPEDQDVIKIMPGQLNTFYVRCENKNEVHNENDYFIKFTVEDSQDMMSPMLEDPKFSILNNDYICC